MDPLATAVIQVSVENLFLYVKSLVERSFSSNRNFDKLMTKLGLFKSVLADRQHQEDNRETFRTILDRLRDLVHDVDDLVLDIYNRTEYERAFPLHRVPGLIIGYYLNVSLTEMVERVVNMEHELHTHGTLTSPNHRVSNGVGRRDDKRASHFRSQIEPIGLVEESGKIISWLTADAPPCLIAIVGMGGLGKTTLAHKVTRDETVNKHFDNQLWVTVSSKSSTDEMMRNMLTQLGRNDTIQASDAMIELRESLEGKKTLLVLDDVWDMGRDWWQLLCDHFLFDYNNKILITTRKVDVVKRDMGVQDAHIHAAKKLDEAQSWSLFSKIAFPGESRKGSFISLGKDIVKKCNGLPLAIKAIAAMLVRNGQALYKWKEVWNNFPEVVQDTSVYQVLKLSYDDLPPMLKHCILCLSVFPEDTTITAEKLVYWWVGEGFVNGENSKTELEVAQEWLLDLANRCLLEVKTQRLYDGRVYEFKIHDMVREVIIKMSKLEKFGSFSKNKHEAGENSRHLGYTSNMELNHLKNNSKLRAFVLVEKCSFSLHADLAKVESLRVLDLSLGNIANIKVKDLLNWIQLLKRISYLNIKGVDTLIKLPKMKKHRNLKILVINDCKNLKSLPAHLTTLENLLVLDVENCPLLKLPREITGLKKLQVLCGFKMGKQGGGRTSFGDLKYMAELRVLKMNLTEGDSIADDEVDSLSELKKLKVLAINSKGCENNDISLLNKLELPSSLEELYLYSYNGDTTPDWLRPSCLQELVYLYIDHSELKEVSVNFFNTSEQHRWKMEGLCLNHLHRLKLTWDDLLENMDYLRFVEVTCCYKLMAFPMNVKQQNAVWDKEEYET